MSLRLKPFEFVLNLALRQDAETVTRLAAFEHKTIVVHIVDLNQYVEICFNNGALQLTHNDDESADLLISGNSLALLKLLQHPDNLFSAEIRIHGDVQFAKQLQDVLAGFDFDWEQQLAGLTGDVIAQPLAYGLKQGFGWLRNTHQSLSLSLSEYLREETVLLPHQIQVDDFLRHVDELRADSDRLEARIIRLENTKK